MTKIKLGLAGVAAVLALGLAACGQTTATTEAPAAESTPAEPAAVDTSAAPATDAMAPATTPAAPTTP